VNLTYLRLEILRVIRNRRVLIFSILLPSILEVVLGSEYKNGDVNGASATAYLMVSMGIFGALSTAMGISGSIAVERQVGWNRQLRLTPINPLKYIASKVLLSLFMVVPTLLVVYALGIGALGVRLSGAVWTQIFLGSWLSALPFAALGLVVGYLAKPDSIQQINGLVFFLLALLGGLWLPVESMPSLMRTIAKYTPTYWAVQVAHNPLFHDKVNGTAILVLLAWAVGLGVIGLRRFQADTARA
jgi:ABC-2 type transport system permease protein